MNLLRGRVHRRIILTNGLLAYSRIGRQKSQSQLVDVRKMLVEIVDLLDVPDSCQIQIQENMPIFTTKLIPPQQVFNNLINNAIMYNDSDEQIEI